MLVRSGQTVSLDCLTVVKFNANLVLVINVRDAERHFDIDEFNDLFARTKPTLYIKMADIFAIHHLVAADLLALCQTQDDVLVDIVRELGSAKSNEHEMSSVSNNEITLQLNPKFHDVQGKIARWHLMSDRTNNTHRTRRRYQGTLHGDEALDSVHHQDSIWSQSPGNFGQANHNRRRRQMVRFT